MDNFKIFLDTHTQFFLKFDNITNVKKSSVCNWLYIFDVNYYSGNMSELLPKGSFKFGKTNTELHTRLMQYNKGIGMSNIEGIQCNHPEKRESLLKRYLRLKTNNEPICGLEYFCGCREYVKILILIIVSMPDDDVVLCETYYTSNKILFEEYLDKIEETINNIKAEQNYILDINPVNIIIDNPLEEQKEQKEPEVKIPQLFICEFCHKTFNSLSSLNYHKKYTKACLQIQNKDLEFHCEHCSKEFSSLHILQSHLLVCKQKKSTEANSIIQEKDFYKIRVQQLEEKLEEQVKEHVKEKDFYKLRILQLDEQVKFLVDQNSKLINNKTNNAPIFTTITENSDNTAPNTNNTQFNNLVVFNCNNVINSIKELITYKHMGELDINDTKKSILKDLVVNSINKFNFCTDSKRNVIVIKSVTGEQTKTTLYDFLADYITYGQKEICNYLDHLHNYINNLVNNDKSSDRSLLHNFEKIKEQLNEKLKTPYKADTIKKTELFKDINTYIKTDGIKFKKR